MPSCNPPVTAAPPHAANDVSTPRRRHYSRAITLLAAMIVRGLRLARSRFFSRCLGLALACLFLWLLAFMARLLAAGVAL